MIKKLFIIVGVLGVIGAATGGACNVVKIRSLGSQSGALNDD
jgi:hypothetical protein